MGVYLEVLAHCHFIGSFLPSGGTEWYNIYVVLSVLGVSLSTVALYNLCVLCGAQFGEAKSEKRCKRLDREQEKGITNMAISVLPAVFIDPQILLVINNELPLSLSLV